ncbi:hypothetical protein [Oricola cellulosilytica]|uniref:Cobalt transporter n=1 Tax=Oricola cellulosilytica TaxID=1429082 RepID=A0A4R0P8S7_9HYPH|nr:hypothetical protein [Oricola cellulosilytica]TCD12381.1 hypothetical protein E0D97_15370 [Oricola cellulosilytica]
MSFRPHSTVLRLAIALAMTLSLLSPANAFPTAFAEAQHHAEMQAEFAEHGHVHDDAGEGEHAPGQGHHPADHSHETPSPYAGAVSVMPPDGCDWHPLAHGFPYFEAGSRLDRPPRPIFVT